MQVPPFSGAASPLSHQAPIKQQVRPQSHILLHLSQGQLYYKKCKKVENKNREDK